MNKSLQSNQSKKYSGLKPQVLQLSGIIYTILISGCQFGLRIACVVPMYCLFVPSIPFLAAVVSLYAIKVRYTSLFFWVTWEISSFLLVLVFFIQIICPIPRSSLKHLLSRSFRHLLLPSVCSQHLHLNREHGDMSESHTLVCSMVFSSWQLHGHILNALGGVKIWVHYTLHLHTTEFPLWGTLELQTDRDDWCPPAPELEEKSTW